MIHGSGEVNYPEMIAIKKKIYKDTTIPYNL